MATWDKLTPKEKQRYIDEVYARDVMAPPRADAAFTPTVPTAGSNYQFGDVGRDAGNEALQAAYTQLAGAVNPQSRNLLDVATNYATGTAGGLLSGAIGLGQKAGGYAADVLGAGAEALPSWLGGDRWSRGGSAQALYGDMQAGGQAAGLGTEASALGLLSELGAGKYARGAIADRLSQPGPVPTMYSNPIMRAADDVKLTRENAPLVGHHNLSNRGVEVARDIGGIPMPSMAISRADYPLTNFGDITLLARPEMVSPSRSVGVWPTDVYTGRQPRGDLQFASDMTASKAMKNDPTFGHMRDAGYWTDATNSFSDADEMMKIAQLGVQSGIDPSGFSSMFDYVNEVRRQFGFDAATEAKNMAGLSDYGDINHVLYPQDLFTSSGNRKKPAPYTLDNVMARMNKEKAYTAGSESMSGGGAPVFRALAAKPFKSMKEIQDARGLIVPSDQMSEVKDAFTGAYKSVRDDVMEANTGVGYSDISDAMRDLALGKNPKWYGNIPSETLGYAGQLVDATRQMPTEYFEAKPKLAYRLGDFPAAIVPQEDLQSVERLKRAGIKDIMTYGTPEERIALFKMRPDLMFSAAGAGLLGAGMMSGGGNQQ